MHSFRGGDSKILWPGVIVFLVLISSKRKINSHFFSSKLQKYKFKIKYDRIIPKYHFFFQNINMIIYFQKLWRKHQVTVHLKKISYKKWWQSQLRNYFFKKFFAIPIKLLLKQALSKSIKFSKSVNLPKTIHMLYCKLNLNAFNPNFL